MVKRILWCGIVFLIMGQTGLFSQNSIRRDLSSDFAWEAAQTAASVSGDDDRNLHQQSGKAFRRSLILPGWGQLTNGNKLKGYIFLGVETALIAGAIGYQMYGNWLEDDYTAYAGQHAEVVGDRSHQFYVDIGNWLDRQSYNEQRIRDRNFDALYINPDDDWRWDSDANRRHFKAMRISSDRSQQLVIFMVSGIIINHLASAIDAARGTSRTGSSDDQQTLSFTPTEDGRGIKVGIRFNPLR